MNMASFSQKYVSPLGHPCLDDVLSALDLAKAENLVTIPLIGKSSLVDYMVIVSGTSERHVSAIAESLVKNFKDKGFGHYSKEGGESNAWVLMDLGNIIVHIFKPETRELYALERMWSVRTQPEASILISG